jgi:hypothetical protein
MEAELVSDRERPLAAHRLRCEALAGADFIGLADLIATLVVNGGTPSEWAVADTQLGLLEGRGFPGLRNAVTLLR